MDFTGLEHRVLAQLHDETVVEFKSPTGVTPNTIQKQMAMYKMLADGLRDDQIDALKSAYRTVHPIRDLFPAMGMTHAEQAWQRALYEVMKVSAAFYASRTDEGRRALEQRFNEMARGNPRRSHKAAVARKVILARVRYALDEPEPRPTFAMDFAAGGSVTSRMMGGRGTLNQISKRYLSDTSKAKLFGDKVRSVIIDELSTFKKI